MDLNKKLIDQLSDLSRNIKSLTSEVKENKNAVSAENSNGQKEGQKEESGKKESIEDQNKKFLKSLEDIFKKGVGEITKSNSESKGILKDVVGSVKGKGLESALGAISSSKDKGPGGITSDIKIPKGVGELLGKIPKFASGGVMDKTGLALVGEKGPEVVKLDKGDKVVPNDRYEEILKMSLEERQKVDPIEYLKATKYEESKGKSEMKSMDQTLSEQKGPTSKQIERYKKYLLRQDPEWFNLYPDELEYEVDDWIHSMRYHNPATVDSLMEGMEEGDTFTKEDVAKLSIPVNKVPEAKQEPEEISKKDQRKKEKEEKRKAKEENKKAEDLLKSETKPQEEKEKSSLLDKGKSFLKEKGVGEKGKNLLFSKGKDILTGKTSLSDIAKNPGSLLGDKSQLMGKGIGAATSLLSNKGLREKGMEKLKGLKKEKDGEEKSSMTTESPELKKVKAEVPKEEKKQEEKKEPKKEIAQTESKAATPEKESAKTESPKSGSESAGKTSSDMGSTDLNEIKSLLGKMVSLLEGPLSIETMESPFRPDSRRF